MLAKKKKKLKMPLVKLLYKLGVKPNHITIIGLSLAIIALFTPLGIALTLFATSFLLDVIDGNLARRYKLTTKFGGLLDSVSDKIVELLFIYYLSTLYNVTNLSIIAAGLSIMISYTKHRAGIKAHTIFDRAERLIFLLISTILFNNNMNIVLYGFIALCTIAITQVMVKARKILCEK